MNATTIRDRVRRLEAKVTCRRVSACRGWAASAWSPQVGLVGVYAPTPADAIDQALSTLERRVRPAGTLLVARCVCGTTYTLEGWKGLRLVGYQEDDERMLELRDCAGCRSTLSVEVTR